MSFALLPTGEVIQSTVRSTYPRPGKVPGLTISVSSVHDMEITVVSDAPQTFPGVFSFHYFPPAFLRFN